MSRQDAESRRGHGRGRPATLAASATLATLAILAGCQDAPDEDPGAGPGPAQAEARADSAQRPDRAGPASPPDDAGWTVLGRVPGGAEALTLTVGSRAVHALWIAKTDRGRSLLYAAFPAGATDTLVRGWPTLRRPDLVPASGGLLAFFVGGATASDEPSLQVLAVDDGGPPRRIAAVPDLTGPPAVGVDASGVPVAAWPTGAGARLAHGPAPDGPPGEVPFCCDAALALARDGDGSIVLAGAVEDGGLRTLTVIPADDGAFDVPHSRAAATDAGPAWYVLVGAPALERVHVVYCGGAGSCDGLRAWRHGALPNERATFLASVEGAVTALAAAATADGRLWAAWIGADSLFAARSAPAGTPRGGGRVAAALPRPGGPPLALAAATTDGALRVVVAGTEAGAVVLRERRLLPGLTVMPPAMVPPLDVDARLRLVVEDAGEPVAGARVRALGAEATTDYRGAIELPLPAGLHTDTLSIHVEASGYAPLDVVLHAARP